MNIYEFLPHLAEVRQSSHNQWMARCPAHPDHTPSLSVAVGDDERILIYCHAGLRVHALF